MFKEKHELIMNAPEDMRVISYCDSSYADCEDTRRSTGGELNTVGGALVSWKSQRQKTVTQSSTEAEYIEMAECTKEQRFIQMLLEEIYHNKGPGIIIGDSQPAEFLVKNKQVSNRTKHIEVRHHYIREMYDKGHIFIEHCESEDNRSDVMTKNLPTYRFETEAKRLLEGNIVSEELRSKAGKKITEMKMNQQKKETKNRNDPIQRENVERFVMDHHLKTEKDKKGEELKPENNKYESNDDKITKVNDDTIAPGMSRETAIEVNNSYESEALCHESDDTVSEVEKKEREMKDFRVE
jgi:hypothetical protein